jgi:ubiquinol-cytochrome c reductase cytochrome b subunit
MYGPYEPSAASAGSQPDWYMGFAEGALRLMPSWELTALGHTLSLNVLIPGVLLIPALYGVAMAYPFLERWVLGDQGERHLLDRPRDAATRTGLGVMALTFYLVLFVAGADDVIAAQLHLSFEDLVVAFRVLLLVAPPAAFWVARRTCLGLQRRDRDLVLHGRETGRLVRQGHGRFFEAHEPLDRYQRWPLVSRDAGPWGDGARTPDEARTPTLRSRLRARLVRFYLGDRVDLPTPAEVGRWSEESLPVRLSRRDLPWDGAVHGGADERPVTDAYTQYGAQRAAGEDADAGQRVEQVRGGR